MPIESLPSKFKETWGWAAPLAYAYATLLGTVGSWRTYSRYNVSVFDYAELNDFLMAAFNHPYAIGSGVVLAIIAYVGRRRHSLRYEVHRERAKGRRSYKRRMRFGAYVGGAIKRPFIGIERVRLKYRAKYRKNLLAMNKEVRKVVKGLQMLKRNRRRNVLLLLAIMPLLYSALPNDDFQSVDVHLIQYPAQLEHTQYTNLLLLGSTGRYTFFLKNCDSSPRDGMAFVFVWIPIIWTDPYKCEKTLAVPQSNLLEIVYSQPEVTDTNANETPTPQE